MRASGSVSRPGGIRSIQARAGGSSFASSSSNGPRNLASRSVPQPLSSGSRSQEQTERKTDDDDEEEEEEDVEDDDYYDDDFEDEEEDKEDEENVPEVSNVKQLAPPRSGGIQSSKPILFSKSNLGVSRGIRSIQPPSSNERSSIAPQNQVVQKPISAPAERRKDGSATSTPTTISSDRIIRLDIATQQKAKDDANAFLRKRASAVRDQGSRLFPYSSLLFDLPPISRYDTYVRSVASRAVVERGLQIPNPLLWTNSETQTEVPEKSDTMSQVPDDQYLDAVDGEHTSNLHDGPFSHFTGSTPSTNVAPESDVKKLKLFLHRTYPLFEAILNSRFVGRQRESASLSFGSHVATSSTSMVKNRPVAGISFDPKKSSRIVCAYASCAGESESEEDITRRGLAIVWNLNVPDKPERYLVAFSSISCILFVPDRPYLVVAGTEDGALLLWDLREESSTLERRVIRKKSRLLQHPSYCTEWLALENHQSPVVRVVASGYTTRRSVDVNDEEYASSVSYGSHSLQIVSIDSSGWVHYWTIVELDQIEKGGSESDLGLNIHGRVRLVKSGSSPPPMNPISSLQSTCAQLSDVDHYSHSLEVCDVDSFSKNTKSVYIATNLGMILKRSRHSSSSSVHERVYAGSGRSDTAYFSRTLDPRSLLPTSRVFESDMKEILALVQHASIKSLGYELHNTFLDLSLRNSDDVTRAFEVVQSWSVGSYVCQILGHHLLVSPEVISTHAGIQAESKDLEVLLSRPHALSLSITSISCNQLCPEFIVAGCDDGSIILHSSDRTQPIYIWDSITSSSILCIQWSSTRSSLFFALDRSGRFIALDLSSSIDSPILSCKAPADSISFSLSESIGPSSSPDVHVLIAFALSTGALEVYSLANFLVETFEGECEMLRHRLHRFR